MKKLATLLLFLIFAHHIDAQIFWTENFESGSTGGLGVTSYSGPNGPWTQTITGSEGGNPNPWYVSCTENGHTSGVCGTGCVAVSTTATRATLHVGADPSIGGDAGASYDAGGLCPAICINTDRRAESPTINCTGRYSITMRFYYIMDGQAGSDYATVWYYDGITWSLLASPAATAPICPPVGGVVQGLWTAYSVALPISANNNANVKIGFRWVNNDDGLGSDPSFAVDSVNLSTSSTTTVPTPLFTTSSSSVCDGSCITFTNTSTGTVDSFTWSMPGVTITTPHVSPLIQCFSVAGTYTMTLTDYQGGTPYTVAHTVTVNPTPAAITGSHSICVGFTTPLADATPLGTWSSSTPSIATVGSLSGIVTGMSAGTTTISYTLGTGCTTTYTFTVYPLPCTTGVIDYVTDMLEVQIRPNPVSNMFTLFTHPETYQSFKISNELGQLLISGSINSEKTNVDISQLPPGLYYIMVKGGNGSTVRKFLKQ